jgi:spore maturation protein CgeB
VVHGAGDGARVKVLIAHPGPHYSVADVYNGLIKGLREQGCQVGVFNLDDRIEFYARAHIEKDDGSFVRAFQMEAAMKMAAKGLEVMCYEWWPDIVIIVSGFYVSPEVWAVLARRPHHVVYWCTESPYEDDRQGRAARYADTVVLNDPCNLDQFRAEINKNTHYFPHSYDPAIHFPGPAVPELASDFAFVGTGFPSRTEWLEQVEWSGINARIGGNWRDIEPTSPLVPLLFKDAAHCMDNWETADVYRSTKASLNLYRKEHSEEGHADGWAMGPREVELAACETFFIREERGEGDALFPMLPIVSEPADFAEQLRWWLTHETERVTAAKAARAAIADRTFSNTAARLLRVVEKAGRKIAA